MAGNYPDVPGNRLALDRDGTVGFVMDSGVVTQLSAGQLSILNNEANDAIYSTYQNTPPQRWWGYIFPEKRDIVGSFLSATIGGGFGNSPTNSNLQTSVNSTNGLDGTWVATSDHPGNLGPGSPNYRTAIRAVNWQGIKACRFLLGGGGSASTVNYYKWHLYGRPSAGLAPDRLQLWHPTVNERIGGAYFDWADVPRNTIIDRPFRVHNPSATLTANSVSLSMEALTNTTPSNVAAHSFSPDGTTFTISLNIGTLAPGETSNLVVLRRTTPTNAALGLWATRIVASASSWT